MDILQTLLSCDRRAGNKTIMRDAVSLLVKHETRKLKEIIAIGGNRYYRRQYGTNGEIFGYDIKTGRWSKKKYDLPTDLTIADYISSLFTHMNDESIIVCAADSQLTNTVAYTLHVPTGEFYRIPREDIINFACRRDSSLVTLPTGQVLRLGGIVRMDATNYFGDAQYDPYTRKWSKLKIDRFIPSNACCIVLSNGDVMITGGREAEHGNKCFIYHVQTNTFTDIDDMITGRYHHAGCLLANGDVFIVGGVQADDYGSKLALFVETYSMTSGKWTQAPLQLARCLHSCVLLPSGEVFISGGNHRSHECIIYNPTTCMVRGTNSLPERITAIMTIPVYE